MKLSLQQVEDAPSDWVRAPLQAIGNHNLERNKGLRNDNLLSLSYGSIKTKDIYSNQGLLPESFETYQVVQPGDIIFRFTDLQNDLRSLRSAIVTEPGIITSAYLCFRPDPKKVAPQYLNYLMRAYDLAKVFYAFGGGVRQSLKYDEVRNLPIALPPRAKQDAIVEFLDRELAQIDKLINLQLELSARLSERKHSLVSSAVYSLAGSDSISATPTLPDGWMWRKLKGVVTFKASNVDKKIYEDGTPVKLCNYVDVYYNDEIHDGLDFMEATASMKEIEAFTLRAGDVIITKDSESNADIGIPSYVPKDLPGVVCGYHLTMLRSKGAVEPKFLKLVLESSQAKSHFAKRANGLTRMALGQGAIGDLAVPLPPLEVQYQIATAIWRKLGVLNEAILSSNSLVQRLRERRSALVSEAVTGKLQIKGGRNG